jgi:zinc D-Ala-D-Ala carboxypeptidase
MKLLQTITAHNYFLIAVSFLLCIIAFLMYKIWKNRFIEGDETEEGGHTKSSSVMFDATFDQAPFDLLFFDIEEFDSKGESGTARKGMKLAFLTKLVAARRIANMPFRINSGFRTKARTLAIQAEGYNAVVGGAHEKGYAADIAVTSKAQADAIIRALREVGFNRFGIYRSWIHVDNDPTRTPNAVWREKPITGIDPLSIKVGTA